MLTSLFKFTSLMLVVLLLMVTAKASVAGRDVSAEEFADRVRNLTVERVPQSRPVRIAIVYPGLQLSDYWAKSIKAFEGRMQDLGLKYTLDVRLSKPVAELDLQEVQLLEVLSKEPDYLVYTVDSPRQQRIAEMLLQRGSPKLIIQNLTRPIAHWYQMQPFLYVGFDHEEGATRLANYFKTRFPQGSAYGVLFWNKGKISQLRGETFVHALGDYHKLVASYYTQGSRKNTKELVESMLQENPDLKFIYACATDLVLGTVDALSELGRTDVVVNGWGGGMAELDAFRAGQLDVVLMRMNDENGIAMAEAIRQDLLGNRSPGVFAGRYELLTQEMDEVELNRLIEQAFIYSARDYVWY